MGSTLLEQTRSLHEDLEVLERAMVKELADASAAKMKRADEVARDQVVATMLDAHQARSGQLAKLYEDKDRARKDELDGMSGENVFTSFYDELRTIREYHRRFPGEPLAEAYETTLLAEVLESAPDEGFTGEEAEGRYVDMHALHEMCAAARAARRRPRAPREGPPAHARGARRPAAAPRRPTDRARPPPPRRAGTSTSRAPSASTTAATSRRATPSRRCRSRAAARAPTRGTLARCSST